MSSVLAAAALGWLRWHPANGLAWRVQCCVTVVLPLWVDLAIGDCHGWMACDQRLYLVWFLFWSSTVGAGLGVLVPATAECTADAQELLSGRGDRW